MSDAEDAPLSEWGLVRALAHGSPLDTAPDHIWRAFAEAMRLYARDVLAAHLWSERQAKRTKQTGGAVMTSNARADAADGDDGLDGAPVECEHCGCPLSTYARDMGYTLCNQCAGG